MVSSVEILDNKFNFLSSMAEEINKELGINFDFSTFVIDHNLTSTEVVLIIKSLIIMNYKKIGELHDHLEEFNKDNRLEMLLHGEECSYSDFERFIHTIQSDLNAEELLEKLISQDIGKNICKIILEDKSNN